MITLMNYKTVMIDKLELRIYGFGLMGITKDDFENLRNKLEGEVLGKANHFSLNSKYKLRLKQKYDFEAFLQYFPKKKSAQLKINLTINPTRLLVYNVCNSADMKNHRSLEGNDNYIHFVMQSVLKHEKLQTKSLNLLCDTVNNFVNNVVSSISKITPDCNYLSYPKISVQSCEVYWDLHYNNPSKFIYEYEQTLFKKKFKNYKCFGDEFIPSRGCESSSPYISGKNKKGEEFKIYAKTLELVRFEAKYFQKRIRAINGSNVLKSFDIESIRYFQNMLVENALSNFSTLPNEYSSSSDLQTDLNLFLIVVKLCSSRNDIFIPLILELIANQRVISRNKLYQPLSKMYKMGILNREARGVYTPTSKLNNMLNWFAESEGEV